MLELEQIAHSKQLCSLTSNVTRPDLLAKINEQGVLQDEIEAGIKSAIENFKATQSWVSRARAMTQSCPASSIWPRLTCK